MKLKFTIDDLRLTIWKKSAVAIANRQSAIGNRQSGIALVITLILLSVTLVMAVAFLFLSQREQGSVTTETDSTTARYATDAALANAEAQINANILSSAQPNFYNFGLLVSTNYINYLGFNPSVAGYNPTNVNYDYQVNNGGALSQSDFLQNLANLLYSPRPPVFIPTNGGLGYDFRYYLDLNRNGRYDTNGVSADVDASGDFIGTSSKTGDPEWIGILEHPNEPYSPNNHFIARYAFFAMPVGNSLDLNYIHNATRLPSQLTMDTSGKDFRRNQGVGSWELNLAAFLTDLNTNTYAWNAPAYTYDPIGGFVSGNGFVDALDIYRFRLNGLRTGNGTIDYAYDTAALNSVNNLFGGNGNNIFSFDSIDGYSEGLIQTTTFLPADNDSSWVQYPWPGADNANHFFDLPSDLFDPTKSSIQFTNRLGSTGISDATYDRYTFYRMMSEMGTDTTPDSGKINLNYSNALALFDASGVVTNITIIPGAETNFTPWQPIQFFTIAADRMLRDYTTEWFKSNPSNYLATYYNIHQNTYLDATGIGVTNVQYFGQTNELPAIGVTNIPVLVNGQFVYRPAVNRLLQLAANIYDATTNNFGAGGNLHDYPSVFRPTFLSVLENGYTNIFVNGYQQIASVVGSGDAVFSLPMDLTSLSPSVIGTIYTNVNVYGVPWIIGAKKSFPNFNEFAMLTTISVERKLEFSRPDIGSPLSDYQTKQMYIFSISNSLGVECWNSYARTYTNLNDLKIVANDNLSMALNNTDSGTTPAFFPFTSNPSTFALNNTVTILPAFPYWPSNAFDLPLVTNVTFLTNSIYVYNGNGVYSPDSFVPASVDTVSNYTDIGTPPLPQFNLVTTNRLQVFMLDGSHVIDYVQFAGPDSGTNLNAMIADYDPSGTRGLWNTNLMTDGSPYGVLMQINYSKDPNGKDNYLLGNENGTWNNPRNAPPGDTAVADSVAFFDAFFTENHQASYTYNNATRLAVNTNLAVQVPYTPMRYIYGYTSWQANDPLVHYLSSDLNFSGVSSSIQTGWHQSDTGLGTTNMPPNLGQINNRYAPWGTSYPFPSSIHTDNNINNLAYKDSLVRVSDSWDFPAGKLPTVGWLGRVHRGTPWQTVFLKATNILSLTNILDSQTHVPIKDPNMGLFTWQLLTGNLNPFDAVNSAPTQDWLLFDSFTTAFNENATRGTLSVNVGANGSNNSRAGLAAWSAVFSGMEALSNNLATTTGFKNTRQYNYPPPGFTNFIISPAGVAGINSALGGIVTNINQTRATFKNVDGLSGAFEHVGDILSVPQLSEQSPFLNWADPAQQVNGISDEMYEWLPQQTMSLLRLGSPHYVIYCYGQALKPAVNGVDLNSGTFFGMVTNYQVTAESAARVTVRLTPTNAVVESFNPLPPD